MGSFVSRHRKKLVALAVVACAPLLAHVSVGWITRMAPPNTPVTNTAATAAADGTKHTPHGWTANRGVRVVYLSGSPEEIGAEHTALLRDRMAADEGVVWDGFTELVPFAPFRTLMFDIARVRYRNIATDFPEDRRRELAAEAQGFVPDPYATHLPTYQRLVTLHALYDIALGFEESPLLGCTAFGLTPAATADGHAIFARAFDFDAADVFDRDKAVFVVHERGKIPFASVAWPGFVGVVTGMNAEGVAVAVHGGRAREPSATGMPVAFSLRETLSAAHDAHEAVAILTSQSVMVSHIVFVGDRSGYFVSVERAPGVAAYVRTSNLAPLAASVTNHFEGTLAGDPRDDRVRRTTTTLARRERIDALLSGVAPKSASVPRALEILRDHGCSQGPCPVGDRRSIDPFIATHGVVADLTARALWVSEGPHLSGKFVKIDPALLVQRDDVPEIPSLESLEELPADPALTDGRYEEGRARAGGPLLGGKRRAQ
jgi:hypothetical protein